LDGTSARGDQQLVTQLAKDLERPRAAVLAAIGRRNQFGRVVVVKGSKVPARGFVAERLEGRHAIMDGTPSRRP
jgi:hypothetical protein